MRALLRAAAVLLLAVFLVFIHPDRTGVKAVHDYFRPLLESKSSIDPAWSPDGRRIAFVSLRDGSFQIYVMDADGRDQRRLSAGKFNASPMWSPDGQHIAFLAMEGPGPMEQTLDSSSKKAIRLIRPDGSGEKEATSLLPGARFTDIWSPLGRPLSWSPDSQRLAFHEAEPLAAAFVRAQVHVVNTDGRGRRALTNQGSNFAPVWSPDGQRLAFTSSSGENSPWQVYVINADGSGRKSLTSQGSNFAPVWSPDGRRLAFLCAADSQRPANICLMNSDGGEQKFLASQGELDFQILWPGLSWSPDGRRLAFHSGPTVQIVNSDGSGRSVLPGQGGWAPVWSPDGQQIAFNGFFTKPDGSSGAKTFAEIFVVNAVGSRLMRLTGPPP